MSEETGLALYEDESGRLQLRADSERQTVWATNAQVAQLFGTTEDNVIHHLQNIYEEGELEREATTEKFSVVQKEGGRDVTRELKHINLDAILSVGYRVSSAKATRFRQWATQAIRELIVQGVVIDEQRLAANPDAQRRLGLFLRGLRTNEQAMYQKVRDVFKASASDYDGGSRAAQSFFAMVQDKFHYAASQKTAAQLVIERSDGGLPNVGMTSFKGEHPTLQDVQTGKNYLSENELQILENLCEQFLLFAESKAFRGQTMTMEELQFKLNTLLTANDYPVLYEYGGFKRTDADRHAKVQLTIYQRRIKPPAIRKALKKG